MTVERDTYAVLQVHPEAVGEVISAAYRALARLYHPDGPTPDHARMAMINRAYDLVKTPEARRRYDAERGRRSMSAAPDPAWKYDPWAHRPETSEAGADHRTVIDFGRYAGWSIASISRVDPDYLRWLSRHSTGVRYREAIAQSLPGEANLGRRGSAFG